jgi:sortase A
MSAKTSVRARWLWRSGLALVVVGVLIFGYVGWQLWGTNWQSKRKHADIVEALEQDWRAGSDTATTDDGTASAIVRIPRFGDDYAVPLLEGTSDEVLAAGIGWFEGSARPGGEGNLALAGHRITHGEPLRDMPDLQPGDQIIVETQDAVHTYVLDTGGDDLVVPFTETWVLDELPSNPDNDGVEPPSQAPGQRLITLTTCSELFHTDDRMIAFGHLERTVPK